MSSQQPYDYYNPEPSPQSYPPQQPYPPQPFYLPVAPEPGRGLAVAGLVLGIISLIVWLVPYIGFPVSIMGIILAAFGRRSISRRTMATVGLVLSIIGLMLTFIVFFIALGAYFASHH